jgi:hypothetical protein
MWPTWNVGLVWFTVLKATFNNILVLFRWRVEQHVYSYGLNQNYVSEYVEQHVYPRGWNQNYVSE